MYTIWYWNIQHKELTKKSTYQTRCQSQWPWHISVCVSDLGLYKCLGSKIEVETLMCPWLSILCCPMQQADILSNKFSWCLKLIQWTLLNHKQKLTSFTNFTNDILYNSIGEARTQRINQ